MALAPNATGIEQYRLPAVFSGDDVTHTVSKRGSAEEEESITEVKEQWRQRELIGKGGFGEVWLQQEVGSEQLRAVKKLSRNIRNVDFSRELATLAGLIDHQRFFVQFYGWYEDIARDLIFLAMEYIKDGDLSQYLKNPSTQLDAREITRQLLGGLDIMHERQICHRDIKPQNILVASLQPIWVKIADFGVSKLEKGTALHTMTGTPGYSAPELTGLLPRKLKPRRVYTNAVDMWALGCLVHEILTLEKPFLEKVGLPPQPEKQSFGAEESPSIIEKQLLETNLNSLTWMDEESAEPQLDNDMIIDFCRDQIEFPVEPLLRSGVGQNEIDFIKSLLIPDPRLRMSAKEALKSQWLLGEPKTDDTGISFWSCHQHLIQFIERRKPGLRSFYPGDLDDTLKPLAQKAETLATALLKRGCPKEMARGFGLLTLYDLVLLIDDSDSMVYDQHGSRIKTLQKILNDIARVYSLARDQGIVSVRFLNAYRGKKNVTSQTVRTVIKGHDYGGVTRIGTELKKKILDKFVLGVDMKKPLLIIVITDGAAEGESTGLLQSVIMNTIYELNKSDSVAKGPDSVAFQFARVGDDKGALDLLERLANDREVGAYVDCQTMAEYDLPDDDVDKWNRIFQLLLGAIIHT